MRRRKFLQVGAVVLAASPKHLESPKAVSKTPHIEKVVDTACCIWEWTLDNHYHPEMRRYFDYYGSDAIRQRMISLAVNLEKSWGELSEKERDNETFDWEFVPRWCRENFFPSLNQLL